jgi:Putative zinc-finger
MMDAYHCDDKDTLVAYLYGELPDEERRHFEGHLRACGVCAREVEGLANIRRELASWQPAEPELGFTLVRQGAGARLARWWWAPIPFWAQVAAATLVLAAGAAIANVHVRYDSAGLTVSTGWLPPAPASPSSAAGVDEAAGRVALANNTGGEDWRAAMAAFESEMRREMQALRGSSAAAVPASTSTASDPAVMRRVQSLIEESEQRQRQELAMRLTQMGRDFELQRRADLVRLEQGVGQFQGRTGAEVARQRELLNYLVRVSGRQVVPE